MEERECVEMPEPRDTYTNNSVDFVQIKVCYTGHAARDEYIYLNEAKFCTLQANPSYACFFDNCIAATGESNEFRMVLPRSLGTRTVFTWLALSQGFRCKMMSSNDVEELREFCFMFGMYEFFDDVQKCYEPRTLGTSGNVVYDLLEDGESDAVVDNEQQ